MLKIFAVTATLALSGCGMVMEDRAEWSYCFAFCEFNFLSPDSSTRDGKLGIHPPERLADGPSVENIE